MTGVKTIFNSKNSNTFKPDMPDIAKYSLAGQALIKLSILLAQELVAEINIEGSNSNIYATLLVAYAEFNDSAKKTLSAILDITDNFNIFSADNNLPHCVKLCFKYQEIA